MPSLACVCSSLSLSVQNYAHNFLEDYSTKKATGVQCHLSTFGSSSEPKMLVPT